MTAVFSGNSMTWYGWVLRFSIGGLGWAGLGVLFIVYRLEKHLLLEGTKGCGYEGD